MVANVRRFKSAMEWDCLISTLSKHDLQKLEFPIACNVAIILVEGDIKIDYSYGTLKRFLDRLHSLSDLNENFDFMIISKEDGINDNVLKADLSYLYACGFHKGLTLLTPWVTASLARHSQGTIGSFLMSHARYKHNYLQYFADFHSMQQVVYTLTYKYLNSKFRANFQVLQIGKPHDPYLIRSSGDRKLMDRSLLVIPHAGPIRFLNRCIHHLARCTFLPRKINVCFDDVGYTKIHTDHPGLIERLFIFMNKPAKVGPYLARHYSAIETSQEYIFFQDSDDISIGERFLRQTQELLKRNLDMIGCHEIRVDQINQVVNTVRFPLDVNSAFENGDVHPIFHPTTLITKKAYLKTGGFSTDLRFGYDSQFSFRAYFLLKMGNIDEFLYVRFRRPNSLTTTRQTKIGSSLRSFLFWRWCTDFRLIREKKLDLDDSSLKVRKHNFPYKMVCNAPAFDLKPHRRSLVNTRTID